MDVEASDRIASAVESLLSVHDLVDPPAAPGTYVPPETPAELRSRIVRRA